MLLSLLFTIISNFAYTSCTIWAQLVPLEIIANVGDNMYNPTKAAMIADISVYSNRGRLYGLVGVAHPVGSIIVPLVGGLILDNYCWNTVFYSIIFSATLATVPTIYLSETLRRSKQRTKTIPPTAAVEKKTRFTLPLPHVNLHLLQLLRIRPNGPLTGDPVLPQRTVQRYQLPTRPLLLSRYHGSIPAHAILLRLVRR